MKVTVIHIHQICRLRTMRRVDLKIIYSLLVQLLLSQVD